MHGLFLIKTRPGECVREIKNRNAAFLLLNRGEKNTYATCIHDRYIANVGDSRAIVAQRVISEEKTAKVEAEGSATGTATATAGHGQAGQGQENGGGASDGGWVGGYVGRGAWVGGWWHHHSPLAGGRSHQYLILKGLLTGLGERVIGPQLPRLV